ESARACCVDMRNFFRQQRPLQRESETRLSQEDSAGYAWLLPSSLFFQFLRKSRIRAPFRFDHHSVRQKFQLWSNFFHLLGKATCEIQLANKWNDREVATLHFLKLAFKEWQTSIWPAVYQIPDRGSHFAACHAFGYGGNRRRVRIR